MRDRRRYASHGSWDARTTTRLSGMILLLVLLSGIYSTARRPQTWTWLAPNVENEQAAAGSSEKEDEKAFVETVVPGATDQDAEEAEEAKRLYSAVSDKAVIGLADMPAYWRQMQWARAQTFEELEKRADRRPVYTQLWEQPDKLRGGIYSFRMHIRRILEHKAAPNKLGLERVYELWGPTDESKSYPYVVVVSELPPGMTGRGEVQTEGVFVGYLLKTLAYDAFDKPRIAPMLIGRMRSGPRPRKIADNSIFASWGGSAAIGLGAIAAVGIAIAFLTRRKPTKAHALSVSTSAPSANVENWLQQQTQEPPANESKHGHPPDGSPTES